MYPQGSGALDSYFDQVTMLVNYSDGRYTLYDIENMLPWVMQIHFFKFSQYLDKMNENEK